jgi:CO/xanthine dehydrogenase Mo-binding subunit
VDDLEIAEGAVAVRGAPARSVSIAELVGVGSLVIGKGVAAAPQPAEGEAPACSGPIGLEAFHQPSVFTHAARVRVDRETGVVRVLQVAAAHDSGRILNPAGASGQVHGGVVMGVGLALTERTQLDEDGRQRNASMLEYKIPTAADAPPVEVIWVETPTEMVGPMGSKGLGEPPCIATAGAIGNAIARAIGARVQALPMTAERVREAANS